MERLATVVHSREIVGIADFIESIRIFTSQSPQNITEEESKSAQLAWQQRSPQILGQNQHHRPRLCMESLGYAAKLLQSGRMTAKCLIRQGQIRQRVPKSAGKAR